MYRKMLVPLDGSTNAEVVMPYVIAIGASMGTEIILTCVAQPDITDVQLLHQAYMERKVEMVRLQLKEHGREKDIQVSYRVLTGKASDEIIRFADETKADLITIASRGESGQVPPLLGHISTSVLWSTKKPVLLIKAAAPEAAAKSRKLINRILLPLDSSRAGEAAIEHARILAKAFDSEIILFEALETVNPVIGFENLSPFGLPDSEDVKRAAVSYLQGLENRLKKDGLKASRDIAWGAAAESILGYTEANKIDLIAMSARGRSDISRWAFGSVTEKILHAGELPLLIVR
jgi:nucleotide-binding universal stress UspA family protein